MRHMSAQFFQYTVYFCIVLITSAVNIHCEFMLCNCDTLGDNELLQSLLFDAEATRGSVTSWLKENLHYNSNNIVSLT